MQKLISLLLIVFFCQLHAEIGMERNCRQKPGLADSYVLALSWQPAFCETYGDEAGKPECLNLSNKDYAATHLSLHGLWPNQKACGHRYGYCGVSPRKNHCAYQPLAFTKDVAARLKRVMLSYAYGSCLERHEWYRHGSCQTRDHNEYFSLAIYLTDEFNHSSLGQYLSEQAGHTALREQLITKIQESFGYDATKKVYLGCKNGKLVDIYIQLPAIISEQEHLEELISRAPETKQNSSCPQEIDISNDTNNSMVA